MKLMNMLPLWEFEVSPASALGILLSPEKLIHSPRLRIYCQMLARGGVRLMDLAEGDVVVGEPIKDEAWKSRKYFIHLHSTFYSLHIFLCLDTCCSESDHA